VTTSDPRTLLDVARDLLTAPPPSLRRGWPRACAALARLALERGLRRYWEHRARCLVSSPMRHQLLALAVLADRGTAALATSTWHSLSRAMHHHTYELPPTAAELAGWLTDTATLLDSLTAMTASPPRPS